MTDTTGSEPKTLFIIENSEQNTTPRPAPRAEYVQIISDIVENGISRISPRAARNLLNSRYGEHDPSIREIINFFRDQLVERGNAGYRQGR